MNACLNIETKGGWHTKNRSYSSEESKRKGVFLNHYDMVSPFEYKDSIFYLKLVFNDVFSEITHFRDSAYTVFDSNKNEFFPQTFVGIIDSVNSEVDWFRDKEKMEYWIAKLSPTKLSRFYESYIYSHFVLDNCCVDLFKGAFIIWPSVIGMKHPRPEIKYSNGHKYIELPDTLRIEVYADSDYKKLCGLEEDKKIVFGEMVFVKRTDTAQRVPKSSENKRKKKSLFKRNDKILLIYKPKSK
jgi:hypothetical protein